MAHPVAILEGKTAVDSRKKDTAHPAPFTQEVAEVKLPWETVARETRRVLVS